MLILPKMPALLGLLLAAQAAAGSATAAMQQEPSGDSWRRLAQVRVGELLDRDFQTAISDYRALAGDGPAVDTVRMFARFRQEELLWLTANREEQQRERERMPRGGGGRGSRGEPGNRQFRELQQHQLELQQAMAAQPPQPERVRAARASLRSWLAGAEPAIESHPLTRPALAMASAGRRSDEARELARRMERGRSFQVLRHRLEGNDADANRLAERIGRHPVSRRPGPDARGPAEVMAEATGRLQTMLASQQYGNWEKDLLRRLAQRIEKLRLEAGDTAAIQLLETLPTIGDRLLAPR